MRRQVAVTAHLPPPCRCLSCCLPHRTHKAPQGFFVGINVGPTVARRQAEVCILVIEGEFAIFFVRVYLNVEVSPSRQGIPWLLCPPKCISRRPEPV